MGCCPSRFYISNEPLINGDDPFSDVNNSVLKRTATNIRMLDAIDIHEYNVKILAYRIAECPSSVLDESKWNEMVCAYHNMCHNPHINRYKYTKDNYLLLQLNCKLVVDVKTRFDVYDLFNFMNCYGKIIP